MLLSNQSKPRRSASLPALLRCYKSGIEEILQILRYSPVVMCLLQLQGQAHTRGVHPWVGEEAASWQGDRGRAGRTATEPAHTGNHLFREPLLWRIVPTVITNHLQTERKLKLLCVCLTVRFYKHQCVSRQHPFAVWHDYCSLKIFFVQLPQTWFVTSVTDIYTALFSPRQHGAPRVFCSSHQREPLSLLCDVSSLCSFESLFFLMIN